MPFHQGNIMSNKPHLRPHQKMQQASLTTRLLVAILILGILALAIALEVTGRVEFRGRLILLRGACSGGPGCGGSPCTTRVTRP